MIDRTARTPATDTVRQIAANEASNIAPRRHALIATTINRGNWTQAVSTTGHETVSEAAAVVSSQVGATGPTSWLANTVRIVLHARGSGDVVRKKLAMADRLPGPCLSSLPMGTAHAAARTSTANVTAHLMSR